MTHTPRRSSLTVACWAATSATLLAGLLAAAALLDLPGVTTSVPVAACVTNTLTAVVAIRLRRSTAVRDVLATTAGTLVTFAVFAALDAGYSQRWFVAGLSILTAAAVYPMVGWPYLVDTQNTAPTRIRWFTRAAGRYVVLAWFAALYIAAAGYAVDQTGAVSLTALAGFTAFAVLARGAVSVASRARTPLSPSEPGQQGDRAV